MNIIILYYFKSCNIIQIYYLFLLFLYYIHIELNIKQKIYKNIIYIFV